MKKNKIFYLLFGVSAILALISCVSKNAQSSDSQTFDDEIGTISKFEYEGHTYLIRKAGPSLGYKGFGGLCHDENCKCKKYKEPQQFYGSDSI